MNRHSEERLKKVHPELARRVRLIVARLAKDNYTIEVVQGLRTYAEQDALYAQGRTLTGKKVTNARGGQSNHNFGLAVDLCPFIDGQPFWEASNLIWQRIGDEAERVGLEWGGNWKCVDKPHVQLSTMSVPQCRELFQRGGLPLVWKRASEALAIVEAPPASTIANTPPTPAPAPVPSLVQPAPKHIFIGAAGERCNVCGNAQSAAVHRLEPGELMPFPDTWSVTVPPLNRAPGRDSIKAAYTVGFTAIAQAYASVFAWWQGVGMRWIYVGLMVGLTVLALAYLYRQTVMGKVRASK